MRSVLGDWFVLLSFSVLVLLCFLGSGFRGKAMYFVGIDVGVRTNSIYNKTTLTEKKLVF